MIYIYSKNGKIAEYGDHKKNWAHRAVAAWNANPENEKRSVHSGNEFLPFTHKIDVDEKGRPFVRDKTDTELVKDKVKTQKQIDAERAAAEREQLIAEKAAELAKQNAEAALISEGKITAN